MVTADTASARLCDCHADEFSVYLAEALRDPSFARLYRRAELWHKMDRPLAIDGREYRRRQRARRRRRG